MTSLYDESSFAEAPRDPEGGRVLGMAEFPAREMGQAGPAHVEEGAILYSRGELSDAQRLVLASMEAYYNDPAPTKVAEEWQIADITYAVAYADQDYRRMNEAQSKANTWRTKAPKVSERPTTSAIIQNLTSSPGLSQQSDDASIMALLGM